MPERRVRSKLQTDRARRLRRDVSATERKLWLFLRGAQLGASFRRQHPVEPFYLDYACVPLKLAVEVDGPWHDADRDAERDAILQSQGWSMLRFGVQQLDEDIESVVAHIRHEIWLLTNGQNR